MTPSEPGTDRHSEAVRPSRPPAEGGREEVEEDRAQREQAGGDGGSASDTGATSGDVAAATGSAAAQAGLIAAPQPPEGPEGAEPLPEEVPPEGNVRLSPELADVLQRLGETKSLDPLVTALRRTAEYITRTKRADDLLSGAWLGHAAHPLMTDLPLGAWLSTSLLDVLGGRRSRRAAAGLLAFGNLMAVPTVATGLAELLRTDRRASRVAAAHASINAAALMLYTMSLTARRRHHLRGVCLALAGGVVATVGGYLGGHLAFALKVGTRDERLGQPPA